MENNKQFKNILPLLGNPVIKKQQIDQMTNKYSIELLKPQTKLNNKIITFNQILGFYLKALNLYKLNLNNYISAPKSQIQKLEGTLQKESKIHTFDSYGSLLRVRGGVHTGEKNKLLNNKNNNINLILQSSKNNLAHSLINNQDNNQMSLNINKIEIIPESKLINSANKKLQSKQHNIINSIATSVQAPLSEDNLNKNNLVKINQTNNYLNRIDRNEKFNSKYHTIPVQNHLIPVNYSNNGIIKPIINQYIKSMSIFNLKNKGIIINYNKIIGYNFSNTVTNKLKKNIYEFLAACFYSMYCLISKPIFVITPDKIKIQLFYYIFIPNLFKFKVRNIKKFKSILSRKMRGRYRRRFFNKFSIKYSNKYKYRQLKKIQRSIFKKLAHINLIYLYPNKFKKICAILSRFFKKPVELDLIRLHYPYNDSNILVNLIGIMINKIKVRIIIRKLFRKAIIKNPNKISRNKKVSILPAFLSGMKIRIAGRLLTHKVIPRQTVKTIRRGAISRGKINFSDNARLTKKNKRGAFSVTITSGQNFN